MVVTVRSMGLQGIAGYSVSAECFLSGGLPAFDIVGLGDAAVKESRERVRSAAKNCGAQFPVGRITVNLAPASQKKGGTLYDLPILIAILAAKGEIEAPKESAAFLGELSLTGSLRGVCGVLPMALAARNCGISELYVPAENAAEATLADGLTVYGVENVTQLIAHLSGETPMTPAARWVPEESDRPMPDFSEVMGQENIKRALEIAAAGGHNVLMIGSPGAGKSMLARRLPSILPDLSLEEALETTEIARSIEALGESLTKSDTDDVQVIAIVTDMLEDAKEKMDAIENGSYTPEENEEDSEDEFEITEDLMETEEDRILDEEEARVSKKIDTITSWIAGAFFIATVVFLIIKSFF